jgi:hypothetical protein
MKNAYHTAPILAALAAGCILLQVSCSPAVVVAVRPDSSGTASVSTDMSPTAENLVRRFSSGTETSTTGMYDREQISVALAQAGFRVDSLNFPTRTAFALGVSFANLKGFPATSVSVQSSPRSVRATLSRDTLAEAVSLMPAGTRDYLDLLMAPVLTGESMTASEYEDIIGAAYGKTLAAELKRSVFTLTIRCPEPITAARSEGSAQPVVNGNSAIFTLPLSTILTLEEPVTLRASW